MSQAFHLEIGADRLATLTFDAPDRRVNVFDQAVVDEIEQLVAALAESQDIGCLVLLSGKEKNFIAGADVDEIAQVTDPSLAEQASRRGHRLFAAWEALPFPTVAAIRGTSMGGGTELALASTFRLVSDRPDIRIGLPEIKLGILPGWGGCVRLPRLIGIAPALDIILAGKSVIPYKALKIGLVDALIPDAAFLPAVRDFARSHIDSKRRKQDRPDLMEVLLEKNPLGRKLVFDQARKKTLAATGGHYPAPLRAIEVVRIGIEQGEEAGYAAEARALGELATSPIAKNLVHVFQLMESVKRPEARPPGEPKAIRRPAVLGAGAMGGGIAQILADKCDLPVRLKDISADALASGMSHASSLFDWQVGKRRISAPESERKMGLLLPGLEFSGYGKVDLVIEAIVEILGVKQKVFEEVAGLVAPDAILASNTSSLSIDAIGERVGDRERVVGMHFFNPVHRMPLVEVIVGEKTGDDAVRTIFDLALALGKTPVVVKDGPGFLVNRLLMCYSTEALWLLDEGHRIEDIDRAMTEFGMPLGPIALTDDVGIDVSVKVAHILQDAFGERLPLPAWFDAAADSGRLGAKNRSGFYLYEGKKRTGPDPEIYRVLGLEPGVERPDRVALAERMVVPMVNEAARCLAEGIARSAAEVDLAMIMGTGFPPFRGGLCRWADQRGLGPLVAEMERLADAVGERHRPSKALRETAQAGGFYERFPAA